MTASALTAGGESGRLPGRRRKKYDISAKMSAAEAAGAFQKLSNDEKTKGLQAPMMQSLLAERFHLALHKGSKDIPVYELGGCQRRHQDEGCGDRLSILR